MDYSSSLQRRFLPVLFAVALLYSAAVSAQQGESSDREGSQEAQDTKNIVLHEEEPKPPQTQDEDVAGEQNSPDEAAPSDENEDSAEQDKSGDSAEQTDDARPYESASRSDAEEQSGDAEQAADEKAQDDKDTSPSTEGPAAPVKEDASASDNSPAVKDESAPLSETGKQPSDVSSETEPEDKANVEEKNEKKADSQKEKEVDLETVTVVGTDEVEEIQHSGYPVTIIDPSRFAGRAMSVTDLLDRVPGVKVKRSGGLGSSSSISIRGLEGKRVEIYIDGAPLNAPDDSLGINDIPLHVIERIEVYKGAVPAKFGGDGLGGAVNIVIVEFPPNYVDATYSVESYNTHKAMLILKHYFEKPGIELGVGLSGQFSSNDYDMPNNTSSSDDSDEDEPSTYTRDHDQYKQLLAAMALHFKKAYFDELELEFVYLGNGKQIQGLSGYTSSSTDAVTRNVQHARTWSHIFLGAVHAERESFLVDKLDLIYGLTIPFLYSGLVDKSDTIYDFNGNSWPSPTGQGEIGVGPNDSHDKRLDVRQRINLSYRFVKQFSLNLNHQLEYSKNMPSDDLADEAAGWDITPGDGSLLTSVLGLSAELKLFDEKFMAIAAFKHFFYSSKGYETSVYQTSDTSFQDDDQVRHNENGFGGSVAARYRIVPWFMIKASYEHGQRMPTSDEVFGDGFEIKTSPGLKPEKSDNFVGGFFIEKQFGKGPDAVTITFESDGFLMYLDDMIRLGGLLTQSYANVDEAKIWGVDGELKLDLTRYFYGYFSATYQDVRNDSKYFTGTTQANYLKGKRIPNIPPYFFNWGAELTFYDVFGSFAAPTEFSLFYDGAYVSEFFYEYEISKNQERKVPAQLTHDVGFQLSFKEKRYSVSATAANITDEQGYDLYNEPLPGRVFKLALRGTFY